MKSQLANMHPLLRSIALSALILGGFAAISTTLLSLTNLATRDAIIESERLALLKNLQEIIPADRYNNDLQSDRILVRHSLLGTSLPLEAYRARLDDKNIAVIITSQAPNGYNGTIQLLTGIYADGTIAGVRVTSHRETPGLGDVIELSKSDWILSFNNTSLKKPVIEKWLVKKDGGYFDQFTGATITPRAVVASVRNTLRFYAENRDTLFLPAKTP